MTALMWAAFHGRIEQLRVLIEKGADPAIGDMDGMTAVHWSVQKHDIRALQVNAYYYTIISGIASSRLVRFPLMTNSRIMYI